MDFGYTPEQQALRQEVRNFIADNVTDDIREEIERVGEGRGPIGH